MNLNQEEFKQKFVNLNQIKAMTDIIESKSLLNQVKFADDARLPVAQEKILFSTIAHDSKIAAPEMKLLSILGHFESKLSEKQDILKENKKFQGTMKL